MSKKGKKKTLKSVLADKGEKRYSVSVKYMIAAFFIAFLSFILMINGKSKHTSKTINNLKSRYQVVSTNLEVLSKKMNQKIIGLERKEKESEKQRKQMEQEIQYLEQQQKQIVKKNKNLSINLQTMSQQISQMVTVRKSNIGNNTHGTQGKVAMPPPPQRIFTINLPSAPKTIKKLRKTKVSQNKKKTKMWVSLPDGSIVKATIVSGIFAPVTSSQWLPTLLNLDEAFYGPNNTRIPLQGCKVLARAQGDYTTSRASVTAYEVSCVLPDGRAKTYKIKGYVADHRDSAYGIQGKIISKSGKYILGSFLTSFIQGFSQGMAQGQTTQTVTSSGSTVTSVTGSAGRYAGFSGTSSAFAKLADYYESKLNKMIDMIYVPSGKVVWLIVQKGCTLKGVMPSAFYSSNPFGGVD